MQLRLEKREVYAIFKDSRRAFNSIPHARLWYKLHNLGISTTLINVVKSHYAQATIQVNSRNALSEEFEITEGVLQGESFSPLLFLLCMADLVDYFRAKGLEGLNIDGIHDRVMLLYADDTVIPAHTHIDLARKLKVLGEYCEKNGLTVNMSKTNIIVFENGGRPKDTKP